MTPDSKIIDILSVEAPRYTSYPSANHFSASVDSKTHTEWVESINEQTTVSAYIHVPFCREMCWFCGCHTKMTKRYEPVAEYVESLLAEIELIKNTTSGKGKLVNIHFGGGSPNMLKADDYEKVVESLKNAFDIQSDCEIALELDPRTTTAESIKTYARLGCNRASIGIQDFDKVVQSAINRIQPYEMVECVTDELRSNGIKRINCDLIYGLPHQNLPRFMNTLEQTLKLQPDRISLFSYAHMPRLKKHQRLIDESWLPPVPEKLEIFMNASKFLIGNGYVMVGMDHFAKTGDALAIATQNKTLQRNFQGYVVDPTDALLGIGCSSISQFKDGYSQNHTENHQYAAAVESKKFATARGWKFNDDDIIRKKIIDSLMCFMEVDLQKISQEFDLADGYFEAEISELNKLESDGIVKVSDHTLKLTTPYIMAIRIVAACFDRYRKFALNSHSKVA